MSTRRIAMRKLFSILAVMIVVFVLAAPSVMAGEGNYFKHFYQWLRDDDGDGVPNCIDPDYVRPEDGTGYGKLGPALGSGPCGGEGDGVPDRDRIRIRDQKRDGTCDGNVYRYTNRNQRSGN